MAMYIRQVERTRFTPRRISAAVRWRRFAVCLVVRQPHRNAARDVWCPAGNAGEARPEGAARRSDEKCRRRAAQGVLSRACSVYRQRSAANLRYVAGACAGVCVQRCRQQRGVKCAQVGVCVKVQRQAQSRSACRCNLMCSRRLLRASAGVRKRGNCYKKGRHIRAGVCVRRV